MLTHIIFYAIRGIIYYVYYRLRFWPTILWARLVHAHQTVHLRIGSVSYSLRVNVREGGLDEDLYINAIREYPNVNYYYEYIQTHHASIDTYIDLGSNIGYYAVLTAKILEATGRKKHRIFCIEPVQTTFALLQKNLQDNLLTKAIPLQCAVGVKNGKQTMIVTKEKNLSRILTVTDHGVGTDPLTEEVQMITPQTLVQKYDIPTNNILFRCDIEGYEYDLFTHNSSFFKKLRNAHIVMELHPFYLGATKTIYLLTSLAGMGFTLQQTISCEPLYFLQTPKAIRTYLRTLFLKQYHGETLGKLTTIKTIADFCRALENPDHAVYHYPNLHLYLHKR